MYPY